MFFALADLFLLALVLIQGEITRRLITGDRTDPVVRDFHKRCEERGVTGEILKLGDLHNDEAGILWCS